MGEATDSMNDAAIRACARPRKRFAAGDEFRDTEGGRLGTGDPCTIFYRPDPTVSHRPRILQS
jgi:hypothetical protein